MSDVDANGNAVNTFLPSFSTRGNKNTTDIRRLVRSNDGDTVVSLDAPGQFIGNTIATAKYQTVADLTGVQTCNQGVEIVVHANTLAPPQFTMKGAVRISSGATGSYSESDRSGLFFINTHANGSHPDELKEESVFIPTQDLTKIQITTVPGSVLGEFNSSPALAGYLEFRIS